MSRWGKDGSCTAGATGVEHVLGLVSARKAPAQVCIMHQGSASSPRAFRHAGNASCISWADPGRTLVFVYLSSVQLGIDAGIRHLGQVGDAALAACGQAA